MKRIKVADLMTDEVVSVAPVTAFKDVAKLLAQYDISGVPVLDDEDRVVGVVSQTDLLAHTASPHSEDPHQRTSAQGTSAQRACTPPGGTARRRDRPPRATSCPRPRSPSTPKTRWPTPRG